MTTDAELLIERIRAANAGRERERLALKIEAMRADAFAFFRGTCHLFVTDWPLDSSMEASPAAWICGDLHVENFGAFKGDNRLEYFDVNDFDEALLAPCGRDVARLSASVLVAAKRSGIPRREALRLVRDAIDAYAAELAEEKPRWVERETASGMVERLLRGVRLRKRKALLRRKTVVQNDRRRIRVDGKRALPASVVDRRKVERALARLVRSDSERRFFRVLDVARRIAGTGSLGVERYVVLVEGRGSPNKNYLLDLKKAIPSSWRACTAHGQPAWRGEAERVVTIQKWLQAASPALLRPLDLDSGAFVLRELQPVEDRLDLEDCRGKVARLEGFLTTMGRIAAWAHLRGAGREGAASFASLAAFGQRTDWRRDMLDYAVDYTGRIESDWRLFRRAVASGAFRATRRHTGERVA